ncbi:MAG: hypothetical protein QM702_10555 [Rubrivivax sp.]
MRLSGEVTNHSRQEEGTNPPHFNDIAKLLEAPRKLVGVGTPEDIAANPASHTGRFLKDVMSRRPQKTAAE